MSSRLPSTAIARAAATLAVALLALAASDAVAARRAARAPRATGACASLVRVQKRTGLVMQVAVAHKRNLPCREARRVVLRCQRGTLHRSWTASRTGSLMWLRRGRKAVAVRTISGPDPRCIDKRLPQLRTGLRAGPVQSRRPGEFGPYQGPVVYPLNPNPPYRLGYVWEVPVGTYNAIIPVGAISTVNLTAQVRNVAGEVRSVWFEYGTTRDLGTRTDPQPVGIVPNGSPAAVTAHLTHLRAGTRYWWRAFARVDDDRGNPRQYQGALGSFVTNPYPRIADPSRPCKSSPEGTSTFEVTESLALICSGTLNFKKSACAPFCMDFYSGRLVCPRDFPRNLNAGSWSFSIPKVGISVSVNHLVSYWRSNDSNRFVELPGKNANSEGSDVGPTPGWHNWDVAQYAYPFTSTSTDVDFWINCTEQWGKVIDASSLAKGDGNDVASYAAPGKPDGVRATRTRDGGLTVTWSAPSQRTPSLVAGYFAMVVGARSAAEAAQSVTRGMPILSSADTSVTFPAAYVSSIQAALPSDSPPYVVVAALSGEGSVSDGVAIPLPRS